jgi:hypothetical protein
MGDPQASHFYIVRGLVDSVSGPSNRVGEFEFDLVRPNDARAEQSHALSSRSRLEVSHRP